MRPSARLQHYLTSLVDALERQIATSGIGSASLAIVMPYRAPLVRHYGEIGSAVGDGSGAPIYQIGSLSKLICAATLMVVSEKGLIDAEMTIAQSFPDLFLPADSALARARLIDLARHASPLGQIEGTILKTPEGVYRDPIPTISAPRLLTHIGKNRSGRAGGVYRKFVYSDFGYALLGMALKRCAGLGYDALVRRHVSQKLGHNYREIFPSASNLSSQDRERVAAKLLKSFGVLDPAFGGLATARDLSLFVHDLVSGGLLSRRATARLVHTPISFGPVGQGYAYGMGIARFPVGPIADGDACLGHLCVFQGTSGFAAHHYGSGMTICFLANALSGTDTDGQRRDLNPGGLVRGIFVDANDLQKNETRLKPARLAADAACRIWRKVGT